MSVDCDIRHFDSPRITAFQFREPNEQDLRVIQYSLIYGRRPVREITGHSITDAEADLDLIQCVVDAGRIKREAELPWHGPSHVLANTFSARHLHCCAGAAACQDERCSGVVCHRDTRCVLFPPHLLEIQGHRVDVCAHGLQMERERDRIERQFAPDAPSIH